MAISRRNSAYDGKTASASTMSPAWTVQPVDGDLLVAVVAAIVQTTITPPSGWTLRGTQDAGSSLRGWVYTRAAAAEPTSYTWTIASASKCFACILAYAEGDESSVVLASGTGLVTPTVAVPANGWLVSAAAGRHSNTGAVSTWTCSDGSDSERMDFGSNVTSSNDVAGAVYDSNRALSAGNANRTLTSTNTETTSIAFSLAFGPTAGGGGPPLSSTGVGWGVRV